MEQARLALRPAAAPAQFIHCEPARGDLAVGQTKDGNSNCADRPTCGRNVARFVLVYTAESDSGDDHKAAESGALLALMVAEFFGAGDNNLILTYGQQSLALTRELGLKELMGRVMNILCWALVNQKQLEQAREVLTGAQAIWRELGSLPQLGEASRFMLIIHHTSADHQRTLAEAPELAELGASTGSRVDQLQAYLFMAFAHAQRGRFGQALDCPEQTGALATAIGHPNEKHGHPWGRINLYLTAGAPEEAEIWADRLCAEREAIMPAFVYADLTEPTLPGRG